MKGRFFWLLITLVGLISLPAEAGLFSKVAAGVAHSLAKNAEKQTKNAEKNREHRYEIVNGFPQGQLLYEEHFVPSANGNEKVRAQAGKIALEWNAFDYAKKVELLSGWQASAEALRRRVESQCTDVLMQDESFLKPYTSFTNSCGKFLRAVEGISRYEASGGKVLFSDDGMKVEKFMPPSKDAWSLVFIHVHFKNMIHSACDVLDCHLSDGSKLEDVGWLALLLVVLIYGGISKLRCKN